MLLDLLEMFVAYYQYLYLILVIPKITYPASWQSTGVAFSVIALGKEIFQSEIDFVSEFRIYFTLTSVMLPLFIIFIGLFALNSKRTVIWFFILLIGLLLGATGAAALAITAAFGTSISSDAAINLLIVGSCILVFCITTFLIQRFTSCCSEEQVEYNSVDEAMAKETETWTVTDQIEGFGVFALFMFFGLVFVQAIPPASIGFDLIGLNDGPILSVLFPVGIVVIVVSILVVIWTVAGWWLKGRQIRWRASHWLTKHAMFVLLVLMSLLYIPITGSSILMFNCNTIHCGDNQRIVDEATNIFPTDFDSGDACLGCSVAYNQTCPAHVVSDACSNTVDQRLESSLDTPCSRIQSYYWPAASLCMVSFVIGLPALFYWIIRQSCEYVEMIAVDPALEIPDDIWASKVSKTQNVAVFLFQPMEFKYRYWRLIETARRIIVVVVSTYVFRTSFGSAYIALYVSLAAHIVLGVLSVITNPFIDEYEDKMGYATSFFLVAFLAFAIAIVHGGVIPDEAMTTVLALVIAIPAIFLIIGVVLVYRRWRDLREAKKSNEQNEYDQIKDEIDAAVTKSRNEKTFGVLDLAHGVRDIRRKPARSPALDGSSSMSASATNPLVSPRNDAPVAIQIQADPTNDFSPSEQQLTPFPAEETAMNESHSHAENESSQMEDGPQEDVAAAPLQAFAPISQDVSPLHDSPPPPLGFQGGASSRPALPSYNNSMSPTSTKKRFNHATNIAIPVNRMAKKAAENSRLDASSLAQSPSSLAVSHSNRSTMSSSRNENSVSMTASSRPAVRVPNQHSKAAAFAKGRTKEQLWTGIQEGLPDILDETVTVEEAATFETRRRRKAEKDAIKHIDLKNDRNTMRTFNIWLLIAGLLTFVSLFFCVLGLISTTDQKLVTSHHADGAGRMLLSSETISGYNNWDNFTSECCCIAYVVPFMPGENATRDDELLREYTQDTVVNGSVVTQAGIASLADYHSDKIRVSAGIYGNGVAKAEKWVCANGLIKERVRALRTQPPVGGIDTLVDSTSSVRGLCSPKFIDPTCAAESLLPVGSETRPRIRLNCPNAAIPDSEKTLW